MGLRKCSVRTALNMVKGSIRTEGREGRLSSVPGKVWGGLTNREMGKGLITTMGWGDGGRVGVEGHAVVGGEVHEEQWGKVGTLERWTLEEPGWLERHREYGQLTWKG